MNKIRAATILTLAVAAAAIGSYAYIHRSDSTATSVSFVPQAKAAERSILYYRDPTGAPFAVRGRAQGSIDGYAAAVGRWLITRDGFDFLVYYLPDYDFASHAHGPDGAFEALGRSDAAIGALLDPLSVRT